MLTFHWIQLMTARIGRRNAIIALSLAGVLLLTGFECSAGGSPTLTVRRFSSIPSITRHTVYHADGNAQLLDPPNTTAPFAFTLTKNERDSLALLLKNAPQWDSLYFPEIHIPNPSHLYLDIPTANSTRTIHISNFPALPPALQSLIELSGRIEYRAGLAMEAARTK
jgi:hypothetical protein